MDDTTKSALHWPDAIHAQFRRVGIRQVGYVPDAGHSRLIELCVRDPDMHDVALTTEEEGVGLVAGAALGGQRAALLMQSSGVGNCVNMFSLLSTCRLPFLALVTMRGEFAEFNPWQGPMSRATRSAFESMGITVRRADDPADVEEVVAAALDMAFEAGERVAVLLGQRLIGRNVLVVEDRLAEEEREHVEGVARREGVQDDADRPQAEAPD